MMDFLMNTVFYLAWTVFWSMMSIAFILGFAKVNGWNFEMMFRKPGPIGRPIDPPRAEDMFSTDHDKGTFACPRCGMNFWPVAVKFGINPGLFNCKCLRDNLWTMSPKIYNGKVVAASARQVR